MVNQALRWRGSSSRTFPGSRRRCCTAHGRREHDRRARAGWHPGPHARKIPAGPESRFRRNGGVRPGCPPGGIGPRPNHPCNKRITPSSPSAPSADTPSPPGQKSHLPRSGALCFYSVRVPRQPTRSGRAPHPHHRPAGRGVSAWRAHTPIMFSYFNEQLRTRRQAARAARTAMAASSASRSASVNGQAPACGGTAPSAAVTWARLRRGRAAADRPDARHFAARRAAPLVRCAQTPLGLK